MKNYFSHDYNSRNDKKLVKIFMQYGLESIGAYWCIIEMLYEEGGYLLLNEYDRITFELRTKKELIIYIINDSELFKNDGVKFWSETAIERLKKRSEISSKARENIEKRWLKFNSNTPVLQANATRNTIKEKKRKIKIKEYNTESFLLNEFCKDYFNEKYIDNKSLKCFDELLRIDNYTIEQIKTAILNARKQSFWDANFQSPVKLRKLDKDGVKYIDKFLEIKQEFKKSGFKLNTE